MWKFSLFCIILSASVGVIFGESKTQLVAENIDELSDVADFFATASLSKLDEMKEKVEKFVTKSKQLAKLQTLHLKESQIFDLLLPPEDVSVEKFSMIKIVLFNEFAKTVNVSLDDILFTVKMTRKQMLEVKDVMEGKTKLPSWYKSKSSGAATSGQADTESSEGLQGIVLLGMESHRKIIEIDRNKALKIFSNPKEVKLEDLPIHYVTYLNEIAKHENVTLDDMLDLLRFSVAVDEFFEPEKGIKPHEDPLKLLKVVKDNTCPLLGSSRTGKQSVVNAHSELQEFLLRTVFKIDEHMLPYALSSLKAWCETPDEVIIKTIRVVGLVMVSALY